MEPPKNDGRVGDERRGELEDPTIVEAQLRGGRLNPSDLMALATERPPALRRRVRGQRAARLASMPSAQPFADAARTLVFERPMGDELGSASGTATEARPGTKDVERQLARGTSIIQVPVLRAAGESIEDHGETTRWTRIAPEPEVLDQTVPRPPVEPEAPPVAIETTPAAEWAEFKRIGLGPSRPSSTAAAKLLVSAYRLLGFTILTAIVVALVGYLVTTVFYMFSESWIVPTIVSATDEKVIALHGELAAQQNERERIARELADAERAIGVEQAFLDKFAAAITSDLDGRRSALRRARALAGAAAHTRDEIRASSDAFAHDASMRMEEQYGARMIDRHDMLDGKHQLAQISSANLSLAERQAMFETEASELARQATSLDALLANRDVPLSYDALKIKREFDASRLVVAKAVALRDTLRSSLVRQEQQIASLRSSALLRAIDDGATVALVPYANLHNVTPGTALHACTVSMVWCHEVGTVLQVLPGEIQLRHPHGDTTVRGQMIELRLVDKDAARENVLFAGGAPLGL